MILIQFLSFLLVQKKKKNKLLNNFSTEQQERAIAISAQDQLSEAKEVANHLNLTSPYVYKDDKEKNSKRQELQRIANEHAVGSDIICWCWVKNSLAYYGRVLTFRKSNFLKNNLMIQKESKVDINNMIGYGFYASRNVWDSAQFATPTSIWREGENSVKKLKEAGKDKEAYELSKKHSKPAVLIRVRILKDTPFLDLNDSKTLEDMAKANVTSEDAARLNPNCVIDYADKHKPHSWVVIKLTDKGKFKFRYVKPKVDYPRIPISDRVQLRNLLGKYQVLGGQHVLENLIKEGSTKDTEQEEAAYTTNNNIISK